jgi:ribonucleoside-diphosphate reductase alpha chain
MPKKLERRHLKDERRGIGWTLEIGDVKAFINTGEFEDETLGEVFITLEKEGTLLQGLLNGFATQLSTSLQYGVPLKVIVKQFINTRFSPAGVTNDQSVPMVTSFYDFLFRKLALRYLNKADLEELGIKDQKYS